MIVQIQRTGVVAGLTEQLEHARADYAQRNCVLVYGLLHPELATSILRQIRRVSFEERVHTDLEDRVADLLMDDDAIHGRLHFLVNDHRFFQVLERLTGCGPIGCFGGTVARREPGDAHRAAWHDDDDNGRLLAMSLDLSDGRFTGGRLQVREASSGRLTYDGVTSAAGDALIFRVSSELEHRATNVTGTVARTILAGWFYATPDYRTWLAASVTRRAQPSATWGRG